MGGSKIDRSDLLSLESSCIPVAVYQFIDNRVKTLLVSDGFCDALQFDSHEEAMVVLDTDMYCDVHPDDVARIAEAAYRFATDGGVYESIYRTRDVVAGKGYRVIHAQGRHVYDANGNRYAIVWYTDEGPYVEGGDTREEDYNASLSGVLREESLLRTSHYDPLTGLPGMGYFFELAELKRDRLEREGEHEAILFVNIAGLRFFNRTYGYSQGDDLIRAVARMLANNFGSDNCGYLSQGCFAVVTDAASAHDAAYQAIDQCKDINGGRNLPLHIGVCIGEGDHVEGSTALDRARAACQTCADIRTSTYRFFTDAMLAAENNRRYIVENLEKALNEGWVQVYYQPIVRAGNGRVCDEEALARWIDPNKGFLSPAEFIPVLEEEKLAYLLDLYVLDEVLNKMHILMDRGFYIVPSSINLSRSDFETCDMVEEVRRRVDGAGIDRSLITIEITESTIGSDFDYMREQVRRFRELGFAVWMDDFGSEYSSLDNLQRIPFDLIKLDMGFMRGFSENPKSRIILTELIRMAIALGIDTVAEGVETQEQVDFLREVGCSKLQGYFFSKPNPLAGILERYETGTAIGFENPAESEYYSALGRVNLYDLSSVTRDDLESYGHYFDTLPMALFEADAKGCTIVRCNSAYRDFMQRIVGVDVLGHRVDYDSGGQLLNAGYLHALKQCAEEGGLVVLDERLANGTIVHGIIRRVAKNPVTGTAALAEAVLSISGQANQEEGITFAHMARALAADYNRLYYLDLDTDTFVEYKCDANAGALEELRHDKDFFGAGKQEALTHIYKDDRAYFDEGFTKDAVIAALDTQGSFSMAYRVGDDSTLFYASLKVVRVADGDSHVVVSISNIDDKISRLVSTRGVPSDDCE